jgi:hypothetical protein
MSFSQHLVLWLHVAFAVFAIGPVTVAIMSTPRYIRQRDVRIVRYLSRITFIFTIAALGVLIAGFALASMINVAGKPWIIISSTLFVVALVLLVLIVRDQRKAIRALDQGAETIPSSVTGLTDEQAAAAAHEAAPAGEPSGAGAQAGTSTLAGATASPAMAGGAAEAPRHVASVERGRIAMLGGVVSLIWLVILVLMIWNS